MSRRLTLKSERLAQLSADDLASVNAGTFQNTDKVCLALTFSACEKLSITCLTGYYPSINAPCTAP
jgi:hypothetical protein